ncbi:hypothetical protein AKJ16_DCAP03759 [Drosera capensis]
MARVGGATILFLVLLVANVATIAFAASSDDDFDVNGKSKPKKVRCKDKNYPNCYNIAKYCPASCARTCVVDCNACSPVCQSVVTASPPPKIPHASPVSPATPVTPYPAKKAKCLNKNYPGCYYREYTCPASCPGTCQGSFVKANNKMRFLACPDCDKPGAVCQDPRFIGGDGLAFYFHGKKDRDFCLVTDSNLHINAHFIGKTNPDMHRDFTWVQALGILFDSHQLYVGAMKTAVWNDVVDRLELTFDGAPVYIPAIPGASWQSSDSPSITITRAHVSNDVVIEAEGKFRIIVVVVPITRKESIVHKYGITDDDCFAHLDLSFKFFSLTGDVNGVLGQTYASSYVSRVKLAAKMPVLGGNKQFSTSGLFATDCEVARFIGTSNADGTEALQY